LRRIQILRVPTSEPISNPKALPKLGIEAYNMLDIKAFSGLLISAVMLLSGHAMADKPPVKISIPGGNFEQSAKKGGVTVYQHRASEIIHGGAEGRIPAPPDQVLAALLDYKGQAGKIAHLSESRVLSKEGGSMLVYQRLNLPVIDDRDFTLQVKSGKDGNSLWVSFWAVSGKANEKEDVVRVSHHRGGWELMPVDGGKATLVRFETSLDIAGSVPQFLARSGAGKELPDLFRAMCKLSLPASEESKCR
jgi:hypothetical protein